MNTSEIITIESIIIGDRLRKDYGDDELSDLDTIAEVGLIEPVILQKKEDGYHLVAGGRRIVKLKKLGFTNLEHAVTSTKDKAGFLWREELPEDVALEVELYENLSRKQMDWKERVMSMEKIHLIKLKRAAQGGVVTNWSAEMTGKELGFSVAHAGHMLRVARALRDPKSPVHEATNMMEAIKVQIKSKGEEAKKRSMELSAKSALIISKDIQEKGTTILGVPVERLTTPPRVVQLSQILHHGKMEEVLKGFPSQSIDGIYTDWPYGIDMDNLQQENMGKDIESTKAEHDVASNTQDFVAWIGSMHRVLKPTSYCVIWCDLDHWEKMKTIATLSGFRVQRWPFHWVKTGPNQNGAAGFNQTKAVEHAMVLRMPGATLQKQIPNNYWIGTFEPKEKQEFEAHPFTKPRKLHERVLSDFFLPGSTILDPFAGGGSIPLAALANSYSPMAVELNDDWFNKLTFNMTESYKKLTLNNVEFR